MMNKALLWIRCLLLASLLTGCAREIDSGEKLPSDQGSLPRLQRSSTIAIAASIPLSRLQQLAEDAAPRSWEVDKKVTSFDIKVHGTLDRGPITLVPAGLRIGFSSPVSGHGSAPATWVVDGLLSGSMLPQIGPDYEIASNMDIGASLSEAKLKLRHLPNISLRGKLEDLLTGQAQSLRSKFDRSLNKQGRIRSEAQKLWTAAHGVTRLSKKRDAYLVYRPTSLVISSLSVNPARAHPEVLFGLGVTAELELVYGEKPPPAPAVSALPPAKIRPIKSGSIALHLPLIADPSTLAEAFSQRLEKHKLKMGKSKVRITKIKAAGLGSKLVLKCRVRDERWWRPLEADLFITATPYLDAVARTLRLRDVELTVQSRNALVGAASYLLSPVLPSYIEERAVYPLSKLEDKAKDYTDRWADDLDEKSRGAFKAQVKTVSVESIEMQSGFLIVDASALGNITTNIEPLLAKAKP